jgi:DNA-binding response OmpR family regulator
LCCLGFCGYRRRVRRFLTDPTEGVSLREQFEADQPFEMPGRSCFLQVDGRVYHSAVLDSGPSSVDGWLADIAAAERAVEPSCRLLDTEARELVLNEGRVGLTPLEFGVMHHLESRQGKVVSRSDLLRDVWGTTYEGGSNVVDAVIRTLRRKMGPQASRVETVTGVGYRLRPA